jgi:glycosyltransferase involved in cell wall biosynthesis
LRLLAITTSQEEGGAESLLYTALRAVSALECDVEVALPASSGTLRLRAALRAAGFRVHDLSIGNQSQSKAGAYVAIARDALITLQIVARVRPDAVLLNLPTAEASPGSMVACALARVQTTAIFQLVRSDLAVTSRRRRLYRRLARRDQSWICVSEDNRETLAKQFGVSSERIVVVRNGAATRKVSTAAGGRTRANLGIPAASSVILTTGRLSAQKGHELIVRALPDLVAFDESLLFVWAGDGPLLEPLMRAVSATGLESHVLLLGRREDIPELLAAADIFLMPSRDEGSPLALVEAMLADVPVVVSDIGALREIVDDGQNGLVFACGDPTDLTRVISRALANRDSLRQMSVSAREQAAHEFSVERMLEGQLAYVMPRAQSHASCSGRQALTRLRSCLRRTEDCPRPGRPAR